MSTARKMLILVLAIIVLVVPLFVYTTFFRSRVSNDPRRLFYDALAENLTEKGVTCTVSQTSSDTNQRLTVQLDLESRVNAHSALAIKTGATEVATEEIVVKEGDFLRYTKVATDVHNDAGQQPDFSKVLNQWIKTNSSKAPQLFGQTALGGCVVPLAHLSVLAKSSAMQTLEEGKVFQTDFNASRTATVDKVPVRQYDVKIAPASYVGYMKSIGEAYALTSLDAVDPKQYANKSPRHATFSVNSRTGRIARITFTDEPREINFQDYGTIPTITAPKKWITNAEANQLVH